MSNFIHTSWPLLNENPARVRKERSRPDLLLRVKENQPIDAKVFQPWATLQRLSVIPRASPLIRALLMKSSLLLQDFYTILLNVRTCKR